MIERKYVEDHLLSLAIETAQVELMDVGRDWFYKGVGVLKLDQVTRKDSLDSRADESGLFGSEEGVYIDHWNNN